MIFPQHFPKSHEGGEGSSSRLFEYQRPSRERTETTERFRALLRAVRVNAIEYLTQFDGISYKRSSFRLSGARESCPNGQGGGNFRFFIFIWHPRRRNTAVLVGSKICPR